MKNKFYTVFDLVPQYSHEHPNDTTVMLEKLGAFETQLEALKFIDEQTKGFGLTMLEVWE